MTTQKGMAVDEAAPIEPALQPPTDIPQPPTMRSYPCEEYPGRFWSVSAQDIADQREKGWPLFHPEDFCHRCGSPNVSWYVDSDVWNSVMRSDTVNGWIWQEIVCMPCFIELAEERLGERGWRLAREEASFTVQLLLLAAGDG